MPWALCLTISYQAAASSAMLTTRRNWCRAVTLLADPTGYTLGLISTNAYVGSRSQACSNRNGTYSQITYDGGGAANTKGDDGVGPDQINPESGTNGNSD